MRKMAFLLAFVVLFSACSKSNSAETTQTKIITTTSASSSKSSSTSASSEAAAKASSEAAASEAAVRAASEAAASEAVQAASEAAASEAAVQAASEAAASEAAVQVAFEAAASEAAAQAAFEAAASEAAAQAAFEAAASETAAQATSQVAASESGAKTASNQTTASKATPKKAIKNPANVSSKNFLSDVEQEVLALQNEERAEKGLQPLQYDPDLTAAARIRSKELCQADMFAHTRTDGREWNTVLIEDVVYDYKSAGENLGMVENNNPNEDFAGDAQFWVDSWIDSPSHYKNMMRGEYNRAGVGIYSIERDGMTYSYATTIFASV